MACEGLLCIAAAGACRTPWAGTDRSSAIAAVTQCTAGRFAGSQGRFRGGR